jgi:hypothetical protein
MVANRSISWLLISLYIFSCHKDGKDPIEDSNSFPKILEITKARKLSTFYEDSCYLIKKDIYVLYQVELTNKSAFDINLESLVPWPQSDLSKPSNPLFGKWAWTKCFRWQSDVPCNGYGESEIYSGGNDPNPLRPRATKSIVFLINYQRHCKDCINLEDAFWVSFSVNNKPEQTIKQVDNHIKHFDSNAKYVVVYTINQFPGYDFLLAN